MKKTEHLKLSQWDPTDRILRQDFNEDNRKIEEALTGLDAALADKTSRITDAYEPFDLDTGSGVGIRLSKLDWKDWDRVEMLILCPDYQAAEGDCFTFTAGGGTPVAEFPYQSSLFVFLPRHDDTRSVLGYALADRFYPIALDLPFSQFYDFNFYPSRANPHSSDPHKFFLYGVK